MKWKRQKHRARQKERENLRQTVSLGRVCGFWAFYNTYLYAQQSFIQDPCSHHRALHTNTESTMYILHNSLVYLQCVCFLSDSSQTPPAKTPKKIKVEVYKLTREQKDLIKKDEANKKVWDEAMESLSLGPVRMAFLTLCEAFSLRVSWYLSPRSLNELSSDRNRELLSYFENWGAQKLSHTWKT